MANLYGVGVGPGDPDLVTIKAIQILQKADLIICPEKAKGAGSTALGIVKKHIENRLDHVRLMVFPMTGKKETWEPAWRNNAEAIVEAWKAGKEIAFLTLGDPSIYSTWSYLQGYLPEELQPEWIPGVSSFCAVAARLQTDLVLGDQNLAIVSSSDEEAMRNALEWTDTLVVMKPKRAIASIHQILVDENLTGSWEMVSNCGKGIEKITRGSVDEFPEEIPYFATMIIKNGGSNE
jgi:precorrin-2/cobalt-factor-2 C20-methyltransferase